MELLKPTVQMARIKRAKISEKKLFMRVLQRFDVKITFPFTAPPIATGKNAELTFQRKSYAKPLSLRESWQWMMLRAGGLPTAGRIPT